MITIENLSKRFGPILAVDHVSLSVSRGEVLGFLGPNGAGKTTTMRMITGFLSPTSGTATVDGHDVTRDPISVRRLVGYLPEGAPLYGDMTPAAFLNFIAAMRGLTGAEKDGRIAETIETLQLADVLHRPIDTLSKGFKRRVGLAQAIVHDPDVLILDEPTDGLDPNQKHQVRNLIRTMSKQKAIIISTHILEEVEAVCTRSVIIADGRVVFDGTPGDLQRRSERHNAVAIRLENPQIAKLRDAVSGLAGGDRVEEQAEIDGTATLVVIPANGQAILHELSACLRESGVPVDEIQTERGHLSEVFRLLTIGEEGRV